MLRLYSRLRKPKLFFLPKYFFSLETEVNILKKLQNIIPKIDEVKVRTEPHVYMMNDYVVYIKNIQNKAKYMGLLKVDNSSAICIGINEESTAGLLLDDPLNVSLNSSAEIHQEDDVKISLKNLGNMIDFYGEPLYDSHFDNQNPIEVELKDQSLNLIKGINKAPYKRNIVSEQLYSGHLRIDLNHPMVQNNLILLKGEKSTGKNIVVKDTIKQFLKDDKIGNRRVVYLTPYISDGVKIHQHTLTKEEQAKCTVISTNNFGISNIDLYLSARSAFIIAQKLRDMKCNVLFVFDKIFEYHLCERRIFNDPSKLLTPTNIFNEIMENCGDFGPDSGRLTSMLVLDTDNDNYIFENERIKLNIHIESISDHIIQFGTTIKGMNAYPPKIDLALFSGIFADYWQKPIISSFRKDLEKFASTFNSSYKRSEGRKEFGIAEDPWENFLFHDSKFIIPLLNHVEPLTIIEQILLFKFVRCSPLDMDFGNEWNDSISEFKKSPKQIINSLIEFAKEYKEFDENKSIIEIIQELLDKENITFPCKVVPSDKEQYNHEIAILNEKIQKFLIAFYNHSKVQGNLRDKKLDYFISK